MPPPLVDRSRLSCSTVCFRLFPLADALAAIRELELTLDLAALPGFCDHFNFKTATPESERDLIRLVQQSGLRLHTFTTFVGHPNDPAEDLDALIAAARRNVAVARELGAHGIVFTCGQFRPRDQYPLEHDIARVAEFFHPVIESCAEAGLAPMIETPHKTSLLRSPAEAALLWQQINDPRLRPILDVNHYEACKWPTPRAVEFIGADRIGIVHLRDGDGRANRLELGTGEIDFAGLFRALHAGGYAGRYSFEISETTDSVAGNVAALQRSIDYLLSLSA